MSDEPVLRLATAADHEAMERVMKASARELGAAFYDARQNASFETHVAVVDTQLVGDGTYFVVEIHGVIAACGGWSRRDKLFTGNDRSAGGARLLVPPAEPARVRAMFVSPTFARRGLGRMLLAACEAAARREAFTHVELMATLPGVPLYRVAGYVEQERFDVVLPDGVALPCIRMQRSIA
ncbi:MAG: GCN5-related N-acetyltransferase [Myxococcaceae bacterium]|nr:GCN5-related N-acetyltransferase [Myxococcaceae bacterium]